MTLIDQEWLFPGQKGQTQWRKADYVSSPFMLFGIPHEKVIQSQIANAYSLARMEVGSVAIPKTKRTGKRWRFKWFIEVDVRVGWSPKIYIQGLARSVDEAKELATSTALHLIQAVAPKKGNKK